MANLIKVLEDDPDEVLVNIRRHWFGIFVIYALELACLFLAGFVFYNAGVLSGLLLFIIVSALLFATSGLVVWRIYYSSRLVVDTEKIELTSQVALFHTKISTLGLANVEDITVSQYGILAQMFNYGTLNIETAGEQANFKMTYCPKPRLCKKAVMAAREKYLTENEGQVLR